MIKLFIKTQTYWSIIPYENAKAYFVKANSNMATSSDRQLNVKVARLEQALNLAPPVHKRSALATRLKLYMVQVGIYGIRRVMRYKHKFDFNRCTAIKCTVSVSI